MGRPKLLLPFGRTTVVGSLVSALRRGGVDRIALVGNTEFRELIEWAQIVEVQIAINPDPERGMLSSILAGLEILGGGPALAAAGETLLISPADLPAIRPATIRQLLEAFQGSDKSLAVPVFEGKRGHPLVLKPTRIPELDHLDPAIGLKQILGQEEDVLRVEVDDPGIYQDVDTPEDYELLRSRAAQDS